jgi:ABC-type glycerol-3-phosphate transport system substrate-binding protein
LLYYNIDQFEQAGVTSVPTNWQEFLDCCQKLKDAGFQPLAVAGASPNNLGHSFISFGIAHEIVASGYDPNWNTKARDGEYDFSTPEWQSILDKAVVLRDAGYFQRGYESADLYECMRAVTAGEVAMTIRAPTRRQHPRRWRREHRYYDRSVERRAKSRLAS